MGLVQGIIQEMIYIICFLACLFLFFKHIPYFIERFKAGVVNAFMLAMLFFITSYGLKMAVAIWMRTTNLLGGINADIIVMQNWAWTISTGLTMISLLILSYITYKSRYDLWFFFKKMEPEKTKVVETYVEDILNENKTEVEKIKRGE